MTRKLRRHVMMRGPWLGRCVGAFLLCAVFPSPARAAATQNPQTGARQSGPALAGVVRDGSGASIPGATIVVRGESGGLDIVLDGTRTGSFAVPSLAAGRYLVTVAAA